MYYTDYMGIAAFIVFFVAGCTGPPSALLYRPIVQLMLRLDYVHAGALSRVLISGVALAVSGYHCTLQIRHPNDPPRVVLSYLAFILPGNLAGDLAGTYLAMVVPNIIQLIILFFMCSYSCISLFRRAVKSNLPRTVQKPGNLNFLLCYLSFLVIYTVFQFIRGSHYLPSIAGIKMCSGIYWIVTAIEFAALLSFAWFACSVDERLLLVAVVIEVAVSGMIGISVGVVLVPMLLDMTTMSPIQSISLSIICVSVISVSSAIGFLVSGYLSADCAVFVLVTFIAGLLFQNGMTFAVNTSGRASLPIWAAALVITIGTCLVLVVNTMTYASSLQDGSFISNSVC